MAAKRRTTTLGEIAATGDHGFVDGPFGSNLPASSYTSMGVPVIRGSNLTLGESRFRSDSFVFVSEETASQLSRSICRPLDIVFTKKGTIGQTGLVPSNGKYDRYLLSSNQMKLTVDPEKADPLFVYYYVSSTDSRDKVLRDSEATGVPKTNLTYFRSFPVQLPHLGEQKRIADILGTLDDKIELNRRMNETLEAMARRLFKSWFIDFDPVHAKAALRREHPNFSNAELSRRALPNMAPEIAELFPDSFEDSTLGPIPKGWRVARIADACEKTGNGGTPRRDTPSFWEPATIPWLTSGEVRQSIIVETENGISQSGLQNSSAKMWPAWSTIVALYGATAGQSALSAIELCANQACCGLQPRDGHRTFLYLQVSSSVDRLERQARGSAQQNLSKQIVEELPVILPLCELMHRFDELATPALSRWVSNLRESRKLEAVRDKLLPRLLSGEVGVQVAEGAAEVV